MFRIIKRINWNVKIVISNIFDFEIYLNNNFLILMFAYTSHVYLTLKFKF
jgi:hypothetical protein